METKPNGGVAQARAHAYEPVNDLWRSLEIPPINRHEAKVAATKLHRHFGSTKDASAWRSRRLRFTGRVRRCWISHKGGGAELLNRGWPRVVHDCAHVVFAWRHPRWRPHEHGHEKLEEEMTRFVIDSGWLGGTLKKQVKAKPDPNTKVALAIARWERKLRLAQTYLKKLQRRQRYLNKVTI